MTRSLLDAASKVFSWFTVRSVMSPVQPLKVKSSLPQSASHALTSLSSAPCNMQTQSYSISKAYLPQTQPDCFSESILLFVTTCKWSSNAPISNLSNVVYIMSCITTWIKTFATYRRHCPFKNGGEYFRIYPTIPLKLSNSQTLPNIRNSDTHDIQSCHSWVD